MKKLICLILAAILLCGCGKNASYEKPVNFYYPRTELHYGTNDSIFITEEAEGSGYENAQLELLNRYLQGPSIGSGKNIFPAESQIMALKRDGSVLHLTLSDQFARLSGIELTVACACLSLTAMELTGAETVEIKAETVLLDDAQSITMTKDTILTLDSPVDGYTDK